MKGVRCVLSWQVIAPRRRLGNPGLGRFWPFGFEPGELAGVVAVRVRGLRWGVGPT